MTTYSNVTDLARDAARYNRLIEALHERALMDDDRREPLVVQPRYKWHEYNLDCTWTFVGWDNDKDVYRMDGDPDAWYAGQFRATNTDDLGYTDHSGVVTHEATGPRHKYTYAGKCCDFVRRDGPLDVYLHRGAVEWYVTANGTAFVERDQALAHV